PCTLLADIDPVSSTPQKILGPVLAKHGLDAVALVPGSNFRRLFGRDFHLMERPLIVIVPATGEPVAIVPNLEMASFAMTDFPGPVFDWRDEEGYTQAFAKAGEALPHLHGVKNFGLEAQRMRVFEQMALAKAFPGTTFTDEHQAISSIRLIKTAEEIGHLKQAIRISEAALEATLQEVRVGQSEAEIENILTRQLFQHGAQGLAFEPIVAAGDNSAQPHAKAREDYRIKPGDALLFDFGASYRGFNADITRTFFVKEVSDFDRAFYETVLAANQRGREVTRPGITASDVDDNVQKVLERSQFAEFRRHKTGHGLGLDVHEAPQIMRGNHVELEPGMVFTVEPGLYRLGECGVRIEDDVVVGEDGYECLTHFSRELRLVG
ncbi:MAG: Xaa-Pro peptidase family protein, partial [Rhizobiaceae bacterium]